MPKEALIMVTLVVCGCGYNDDVNGSLCLCRLNPW